MRAAYLHVQHMPTKRKHFSRTCNTPLSRMPATDAAITGGFSINILSSWVL
jgi:hypothetical protein